MLKIYALINGRRTLFLGLSRTNCERLLDDQPIRPVSLDYLTSYGALPGPVEDVIIFGGETEAVCHAHLARYFPELPPYREALPGEPFVYVNPVSPPSGR